MSYLFAEFVVNILENKQLVAITSQFSFFYLLPQFSHLKKKIKKKTLFSWIMTHINHVCKKTSKHFYLLQSLTN